MKKILVIILSLILISWTQGYAGKKRGLDKLKYPELRKFSLPQIEKFNLENGIKLRLIKNEKLPLIDLYIMFKGGDVYDPGNKVGIGEITAQLLRIGGTEKLSPTQIDQFLDSKGINLSFTSTNDFFYVYISCLQETLQEAIAIFSEILKKPAFDKEKLEELKTKNASAISRRNDQPGPINSREFHKLIYGDSSPFAVIQEYEHLDNISKKDISKYHQRFFTPDNMLIGITGPIEMSNLIELFKKYLGSWQAKSSIPPYPRVKSQKHDFKVAFAEKSNLTQSYLSIGHLGIEENLKEKAKIMVFNAIFSQGFDSRLNTRVRTKMGLTYGIGGGIISQLLYPGKTYFSTFTKSKSTIKAIKAIFEEMKLIREEEVSEQELKDAKNFFINSHVFKYSSPEKILFNELKRELYNLPEGYSEKIIKDIENVTGNDIKYVAQTYLHPEKMIIFILGKENDLDAPLTVLGKVKKIDITIPSPPIKEKIPEATPEMLAKGRNIINNLMKKNYQIYRNLQSLQTKYDAKLTTPQGTFQATASTISLFPDKSCTETTIMGMKITRIINGNRGIINQMGKEMSLSKDQIERERFSSFYRIFNQQKEYDFQYLPEQTIKDKKYQVVYVFDNQGNWLKLYINQKMARIEITEKIEDILGQSGVARTILSDFKKVKGTIFAFSRETYIKNKKIIEISIKEIQVNPKINPGIFKIKAE